MSNAKLAQEALNEALAEQRVALRAAADLDAGATPAATMTTLRIVIGALCACAAALIAVASIHTEQLGGPRS